MSALNLPARTLLALIALLLLGALARKLWCERHPRLGSLMDDGDGQGGVPPLPRRQAAPVIHPAFEEWLATPRCRWCNPGEQWIQTTDRCTCTRGFCGAEHCLYDLQEQLYGGER